MGLKDNALPLDDLARLNEHGVMTKLILGPLVVLAGLVAAIALVRFLQRMRDRSLIDRFRGED